MMTNWAKISTIPSCKSLIWFYFIEIIKYKKITRQSRKIDYNESRHRLCRSKSLTKSYEQYR